jgi:hypothetical protein
MALGGPGNQEQRRNPDKHLMQARIIEIKIMWKKRGPYKGMKDTKPQRNNSD